MGAAARGGGIKAEPGGAARKAGRADRIRCVRPGDGTPDESRQPPLVSVVAPVYCEERLVGEFYGRCKQALEALAPAIRHELVFVNDGSTHGSLAVLLDIAQRDPAVRAIDLSRNFGHPLAITAGMHH